jgi:hypothetical protein
MFKRMCHSGLDGHCIGLLSLTVFFSIKKNPTLSLENRKKPNVGNIVFFRKLGKEQS